MGKRHGKRHGKMMALMKSCTDKCTYLGTVPEYYLQRECPYPDTVLKFLYGTTKMLHCTFILVPVPKH